MLLPKEAYESIYKEEEEERSQRWERFLQSFSEENFSELDLVEEKCESLNSGNRGETPNADEKSRSFDISLPPTERPIWKDVHPTIFMFEQRLRQSRSGKSASSSVELCDPLSFVEGISNAYNVPLTSADEIAPLQVNHTVLEEEEDDFDEVFFDADRSDATSEASIENGVPFQSMGAETTSHENLLVRAEIEEEEVYPWTQELQLLVQGGIPMTIRGELWQVFAGTRTRRVESHYEILVTLSTETENSRTLLSTGWVNRIDKDLSNFSSNHPASKLDEEGLCALRRLLHAYCRHNPYVRYCQAVSKIAALLLFFMPEENAFWTLSGILDDCVQGYYSHNMREPEVDHLIFENLMQEYFPRMTTHLETIGVKLSRVTRHWFLHVLIGVLPWESVLRVWDVLLFERTRCILFRTGLALFEMHAQAVMASHDSVDVIQIMQSRTLSTFDGSQLVFTACMGFSRIDEPMLLARHKKHRPSVLASSSESLGKKLWKSLRGVISKRVSSNDQQDAISGQAMEETLTCSEKESHDIRNSSKFATLNGHSQFNGMPDLCEEGDLRQQVEMLKSEVSTLKHKLAEKEEQEKAMAQVIVRMEYENKITEDARRYAEQDANKFQKMYKEMLDALARMEKRAMIVENRLISRSQFEAHDSSSGVGVSGQKELEEVSPKLAWLQSFSSPKV